MALSFLNGEAALRCFRLCRVRSGHYGIRGSRIHATFFVVIAVNFVVSAVKEMPKANYETPEQLAARIKERELDASLLPLGAARQSVLIEVAKLRAYADVKRWLASDS